VQKEKKAEIKKTEGDEEEGAELDAVEIQELMNNDNPDDQPHVGHNEVYYQRHTEFKADAILKDCFKSVLKVYRIHKPEVIDLSHQHL
jgi:hypothetical protein